MPMLNNNTHGHKLRFPNREKAQFVTALSIDPGRMTQALTNILDNALQRTPEGGRINLSAKNFESQARKLNFLSKNLNQKGKTYLVL